MSAFLASAATEINVCAEYGYSTRNFEKRPRVTLTNNYKSCVFLVHQQSQALPNRKENYHNHFTLFKNATTIVIVRTETTLIIPDNDAILHYDIITPSASIADRFRAIKGSWDISFDRIAYTNERPNFLDYELICSGEWWFFDRGIVLNGLTRYVKHCECLGMLVYYELHPTFEVKSAINPTTSLQKKLHPWAAAITTPTCATTTTTTTSDHRAESVEDRATNCNAASTANVAISPTICAITPAMTTCPVVTAAATAPAPVPAQCGTNNFVYSRPHDTAEPLSTGNPLHISTLATSILPSVNATSRLFINKNDEVAAPDIQYEAVVPSLFWFTERAKELCNSDISYFLPMNYKCASH